MPCGLPPFQLSAFVAKLIAKLQGIIMAKVMELVAEAMKMLQGACPDLSGIKSLIKKRDNLINAITKVEQKIEPVGDFADNLNKPLKAAKVIVTLLEFIPIPSTIGTPPLGGPADVGGQIYSMPVGKMNRFSSLLRLACKLVEELERETRNIKELVGYGLENISPTKEKLMSIDIKLFECVENLPQDQKDEVMNLIENLPSNIGLTDSIDDGSGNPTFSYTKPSSGNNYTIKVLNDANSPSFAPKRYAVALNDQGVKVLQGPSSFSSSTKILVDEIKFRINNQLP